MTKEEAMLLAERTGFSHWGIFPASGVRIMKEVRQMCASDKCRMYGRSWSCPPACITLDEAEKKISGFGWGILLQTTGYLEDSFDYESMQETERKHKEMLYAYADSLADSKAYSDAGSLADSKAHSEAGSSDAGRDGKAEHLMLGSGACSLCEECTFPDDPCRMPDRMISSMEAFGIMVADVCTLAGMAYYHGERSVTYSGCVLFI